MSFIKNKYILPILTLLMMAFSSCTDELSLFGHDDDEDTDGKVTLRMSMYLPDLVSVETRGVLDEVPDVPTGEYLSNLNFYIFVFEDNGNPHSNYLRQIVYDRDILEEPTVTEDEEHNYVDAEGNMMKSSLVTFKVRVDGTTENAILHIVATADDNFEDQLQEVPDRSEFGIFAGGGGVFTSNKEAYWKRVELDKSLSAANKDQILPKLTHLKMIRNYARVTIKKDITENPYNFVIDAFEIANSVDKGYVAAYNENLGSTGFAGFLEFENAAGKMKNYRELHNVDRYVPARHPASERKNADDELGSWAPAFEQPGAGNMLPKYVFERAVQDDNKTVVILKGHYADRPNDIRFIKLDVGTNDMNLADETTQGYGVFETMDMIRNISYDFTITKIGDNDLGHPTVEGALGSPPSNNISVSVETRPVTRINDGIDEMIVNKTTWVVVDDDSGNANPATADMIWSYQENFQTGSRRYVSDEVKWNYPGYDINFGGGVDPDGIFESWDGQTQSGQRVTPVNGDEKVLSESQRAFTFHFKKPDNINRQKTVRLYRPNGLARDITFILHKRWQFVDRRPELGGTNIEVYPGSYSYENGTMPYKSLNQMREEIEPDFVGSQRGAQLTVMFELPEDLPEAIFPLDFKIGFSRQNVDNAYEGNAVATWGPSVFSDQGDMPRMQYIKTVTYDYYEKYKIVCAQFVTTTSVFHDNDVSEDTDGEVTSNTKVRITNPYFTFGNVSFDRSSTREVIDKTRNSWYWNFERPEWSAYFDTYYGTANDPFTLDDLYFGEYTHGTKDDYTNVNGRFMQPKADGSGITRSSDNPEFYFHLDSSSPTGYTATMTIEATPNRDRQYLGATYRYNFWYRTVWVEIITQNHPEGMIQSQNCDGREGAKAGTLNRYRLDLRTLTYSFDIEPNDVVQEVKIWSERREGPGTTGLGTYNYLDGETRYYSILFTLKEK